MAKIHRLKTWPEYFKAVDCGRKEFEIRLNDRDFQVDDILVLDEWDPAGKRYTKAKPLVRMVRFTLTGFGVGDGYVAMGIAKMNDAFEQAMLHVAPSRDDEAAKGDGT